MNILKYRDYEGTAEVDMERFVCRGKILFIDDLVTYQASSPAELKGEFEAAVDDYIDTCHALGREPKKPLKGQFNVRIPAELHKAAILRSLEDNISLNDVVVRSMDAFLNIRTDVNHNVMLTVNIPQDSLQTFVTSASQGTQLWGAANVH